MAHAVFANLRMSVDMNKKTLISLFAESLFQIPDYQRGYAWEEKQWKDFIQDIDAV